METWRIFNTDDIVPTVPPAAVQFDAPNVGMHRLTPMTQAVGLTLRGYGRFSCVAG